MKKPSPKKKKGGTQACSIFVGGSQLDTEGKKGEQARGRGGSSFQKKKN